MIYRTLANFIALGPKDKFLRKVNDVRWNRKISLSGLRTAEAPFASAVAILAIVGIHLFVHRYTLLGQHLFIGNPDRLNTFLNLRVASVREIIEYGHAANWNENMFMGFSTAGLHWIFPLADPVGYLLAVIRPDNIYWALNTVSAIQLALTGVFAYLFIRNSIDDRISAVVGACLYSLSVFSIQRNAQGDTSHLVMTLLPLSLWFVRKIADGREGSGFIGLGLTIVVMLEISFLQDAFYALILIALFVVYFTATAKNIRLLFIAGFAALAALMTASPRLWTVFRELQLLVRTGTNNDTSFFEIFRIFDDGIFGRFFGEAQKFGNGLNISEGIQLLNSTAAVTLVLLAISSARTASFRTLDTLLKGLLLAPFFYLPTIVIRRHIHITDFSNQLVGVGIATVFVTIIAIWAEHLRRQYPQTNLLKGNNDTLFAASIFLLVLYTILIPEARYLVYRLFLSMDFTHSRLSLVAILPIALIVSACLQNLSHNSAPVSRDYFTAAAAILAILFAIACETFLQATQIEKIASFKLLAVGGYSVVPYELIRTLGTVALVLLAIFFAQRTRSTIAHTVVFYFLAALILTETVLHADFRLNGAQTLTFPVPFKDGDFFNAPPTVMQLPDRTDRKEITKALQTEHWRTAAIINPAEFPAYGGVAPHLSQFWHLRFVEGYSTGVPKRVAALPWPDGHVALRAISFSANAAIPTALLALLNVKWILPVSSIFYFNEDRPEGVSIITPVDNPYPVVPRQFFVSHLAALPTGYAGYKDSEEFFEKLRTNSGFVATYVPKADATILDLLKRPDGTINPTLVLDTSYVDDLHIIETLLAGRRDFPAAGRIRASYKGDRINIEVDAINDDRILVLNELYHPSWKAYAQNRALPVFPVNIAMRAVFVPRGVSVIEMRYEPFVTSLSGKLISAFGLLILAAGWITVGRGRQQPLQLVHCRP